MTSLRTWCKAIRVQQWTKNGIVFAAYIFALGDQHLTLPEHALLHVILGCLLFCLTSSAVYLFNDLNDREQDKIHPDKQHRPIASGQITPGAAGAVCGILLITGLAGAWMLAPNFGKLLAGYVGLQLAYTGYLKRIALVDVFIIAIGFVIRAMAGAVILSVPISPWLLLCTLMLALFLALCKRRHEKMEQRNLEATSRDSLRSYDVRLLDQLIAITSAASIVCYALYTLWPETVAKYSTHGLGFTIPFVMFGIFRYMYLVYQKDQGGKPETVLLTDPPTWINILLYGGTVLAVLFRG